jgi:hypothetical protein
MLYQNKGPHEVEPSMRSISGKLTAKWNAHACIHFETQNAPWVFMLCNSLNTLEKSEEVFFMLRVRIHDKRVMVVSSLYLPNTGTL